MRPPQELTASRAPEAPSRFKLLFSIKNWRIRTRITALLLLPVVVAALLGGLRIQSSVDKTREMDVVQKAGAVIDEATTLVAFLEEERDFSAAPLAGGGTAPANPEIMKRYTQTNDQFERFKAAVAKMDLDDLPLISATVGVVASKMNSLANVRKQAYSTFPFITVKAYQDIITSLLSINQQAPEITRDPDLVQGARALGLFGELKAQISAGRAIGAAYGAKPDEKFNDAGEGFKSLISGQDDAIRKFQAVATPEENNAYDAVFTAGKGANVAAMLTAMQSAMVDSNNQTIGGVRGAKDWTAQGWYDMSTNYLSHLMKLETDMGDQLLDKADSLRDEARKDALVNTVLVVAALLFTIILGVIVARSLVRSLNTLRRSALEIAEQRLPETVRRLAESEPGDVDLTVEPIGVATRDEVGQVARAFDAVHTEAVRLAAEQALLRGNVNSMFVNLSRRSQSLIQRQLALISDLENREADPDQLANLFKLDHLATRMRRNGENLLVLAGEEPGRRWTRPVPLVDVLRAAASEVEQYERVELGALPTTDIAGRAVNDLVHLLAELLENSTTFSSPHTKVRVTGHILPDGRALIEIHDNGIGLTGDDLADANQRLARPPVVDVSISRRMGLFVVGRLSTRHGIRVQLRPGDGGGTTALVMLPIELIQGDRPGGNWDKSNGRAAVAPGWEPDALNASQEMHALPAAAAGPQRPGPDAGRSEAPRSLPQRAANQAPQNGAYEQASAFGEGPAAHDTPFPGTPFPQQANADNPFAPVAPQAPRVEDARPVDSGTGTAQFQSPFAAPTGDYQTGQHQIGQPGQPYAGQQNTGQHQVGQHPGQHQSGQQPTYGRPQFDQTQQQEQPLGDYAQPSAYARPEYEQPYQQQRFDQEPIEHGRDDRGQGGLPRRGGQDTGAMPMAEPPQQQRATAWSGPEYDSLSPVAPPQQMPAYEAPQRRDGDVRPQQPPQPQPGSGDALPALRTPGAPVRRQQPPPQQPTPQQADARTAQQDPRALYRDDRQPQPGQQGQQGYPGPAAQPEPQQNRGLPAAPQHQVPQQLPQQLPQHRQLPVQPEPVNALDSVALPQTVEDERSPIFETLESDWFHRRTGRGGRMRAAQVRTSRIETDEAAGSLAALEPQTLDRRSPGVTNPPLPQRGSEQGPLPRRSHAGPAAPAEPQQEIPQQPLRQAAHAAPVEQPQQQPAAPQPGRPAAEQAPSGWYSAGDEGWRAAEAAREPASGGTTTAGLPRRVPRANLVPGGVGGTTTPAPAAPGPVPGTRPGGPAAPLTPGMTGGAAQVPADGASGLSRNPDDVRGRLTNFRRGIQQGRTAGAGGMAPQPRDENNQEQA